MPKVFGQASPILEPAPPVRIASPSSEAVPNCFDENQIALMAYRQSVLSKLLCQESANLDSFSQPHSKNDSHLASRFLAMLSSREAQRSAEQAMRAHFGLHSTLAGLSIVQESIAEIDQAIERQKLAIQNGIPIPDPTRLEHLRAEALDKQLQLKLVVVQLRNQLSLLIPHEVACHYLPCEPRLDMPLAQDVCEEVRIGLANRCDLQALRLLATEMTEAEMDLVPWAASRFTGLPPLMRPAAGRWFNRLLRNAESQGRLDARRKQLVTATEMTEHKIASEIDVSYMEMKTALARLQLADETLERRRQRVIQLDAMEELGRPQVVERQEAQLEWIAAKGKVIERANDYLQAYAVHQSSTGRISFK